MVFVPRRRFGLVWLVGFGVGVPGFVEVADVDSPDVFGGVGEGLAELFVGLFGRVGGVGEIRIVRRGLEETQSCDSLGGADFFLGGVGLFELAAFVEGVAEFGEAEFFGFDLIDHFFEGEAFEGLEELGGFGIGVVGGWVQGFSPLRRVEPALRVSG